MTDSYLEDDINLRDYWRVIARQRLLVLSTIFTFAIVSAVISLLLPNVYQSAATLMPLGQPNNSLRATLGELGGLLPLGGVGDESPAERLLAVLQSRTLTEDVIKRLNLLPLLFADVWNTKQQTWQTDEPPTLHDAVLALKEQVSITSDSKTGVIKIAVEHSDPELAAKIANQYIDALQRALNENAFSLAKKNRLFLEAQWHKTRQALESAEDALRVFEQEHGIVALDVQTQAVVNALATLEGKIIEKEVQLSVLQRTRTGASQEVYLLQEELHGLRRQLSLLKHGKTVLNTLPEQDTSTTQAPLFLDKTPEIKLEYARLQRDALVQNKLFTLFVQQLEQARIDEAKDETAFQVLDKAIAPPLDFKIKPKRKLIVILSTVVGAFLGVFLAFFRDYLDTSVRSREQIEQQLGMAVLTTLPPPAATQRQQREDRELEKNLMMLPPLDAPTLEALRYLHTRLKHLDDGETLQSLLITSPEPDESAPLILANLAIVAANAGENVLLIDGNLRHPVLHRLLSGVAAPGLVELLADPEGWPKGVQPTAINNLHLLAAGNTAPAIATALSEAACETLLANARTSYDLILCAAPPVLGSSDAAALAHKFDAVCLVLTSGHTQLDSVNESRLALEAIHAHIVGAIYLA